MDDFGTYLPHALADLRESFPPSTMYARALAMYAAHVRFMLDGMDDQ